MELGGRFWLGVLGIAIGGVIAFLIVLSVVGWAWWNFGFFGGLVFICLILLLVGWITDRRTKKRYEDIPRMEDA